VTREYRYPTNRILFPNSFILSIPLALTYVSIRFNDAALSAVSWTFGLMIGVPVVTWLLYNLSVRITVDEQQMTKRSFLGSKSFRWVDVESVKWRTLNDADVSNKLGPSDLTIKTKDGRKMDIFSIIQRTNDGTSAITELESYITTRVPLTDGSKEQQQTKEMQKQLRLLVVGGVLAIVMGLTMLQRPITPEKEKLGIITKKIGMSADALALMACGVGLIGFGIYKLRKPSN